MAWTTPRTWVAGAILTAAQLNEQVRDNLSWLYGSRRLATVSQSSTGTVASVLSGNMNKLFGSNLTWTADGSSTYIIEVYLSLMLSATNAGSYVVPYLVDNAGAPVGSALGFSPQGNGTQAGQSTLYVRVPYTPSAGTATLNVGAFHAVAAGTIGSVASSRFAYMSAWGPALV